MQLPPGVTGFFPRGEPLPAVDVRAFHTACYHAARRTGGVVAETARAGVTPNFHTVVVAYRDEDDVAVLCHVHFPLLALAVPLGPGDATVTFVDRPHLAQALEEESTFRVVPPAQLHEFVLPAHIAALTKVERDQVRLWKPETVGELLFNFWD